MERAILAGGCFWGMQALLRKCKGVIKTRVGYTGSAFENPGYQDVKTGTTGHAEAIEIIFDESLLSYRELLEIFFQIHDPTTLNQQGNDIGSQYRSEIFFTSERQKEIALATIEEVDATGLWPGKIVTKVSPEWFFFEAEDFHQDYLEKHPSGYTCHFPRKTWQLPK